MSIQLEETDGGRVLEVHASSKLEKVDYLQFTPEAERLIKNHGKISVLFDMADFHGWKAGAVWEDIKFDMKHFSHIEKVAMIGEKKWQKAMSAVCKPFTTAKVRYFERPQLDEARAWLTHT